MARTKQVSRKVVPPVPIIVASDGQARPEVVTCKQEVRDAVTKLAQFGTWTVTAGVMRADRFFIYAAGAYDLPPVDQSLYHIVATVLQLIEQPVQALSAPAQTVVDGVERLVRGGGEDDDDEDDDDEDAPGHLTYLANKAVCGLQVVVARAFAKLRMSMACEAYSDFFNEVKTTHNDAMCEAMASTVVPTTTADVVPTTTADGGPTTTADGGPTTTADCAPATTADGATATTADGATATTADSAPATTADDAADGGMRKRART